MRRFIMKMLWLSICAVIASLLLFSVMNGSASGEEMKTPDTIVIKHIQNKYGPVTFDHMMHVDMAESCGECHHIHNDKINSTCSQCHALNPDTFRASVKQGFPPCSRCHMDYSPETPWMPGLKVALHKKCFGCHVGIGELGSSPAGCVEMCHTRIISMKY